MQPHRFPMKGRNDVKYPEQIYALNEENAKSVSVGMLGSVVLSQENVIWGWTDKL